MQNTCNVKNVSYFQILLMSENTAIMATKQQTEDYTALGKDKQAIKPPNYNTHNNKMPYLPPRTPIVVVNSLVPS